MQNPIIVCNSTQKREVGRVAQISCIKAAKYTADLIRTCLGPCAMIKMVMDTMGTLLLTNDGNEVLREIEASHPAAKSVIELARAQDEEVGDGTTTVVVLAGEILASVEPLIQMGIHPHIVVSGLRKVKEDALNHLEKLKIEIDPKNDEQIKQIIKNSVETKFLAKYSDLLANLALEAVKTIHTDQGVIDLKKQLRIERIPGGEVEDSRVLKGVMIEKDVVHSHMKRKIINPKVLVLDCGLEYKKGESITNIEISGENDYANVLKEEEQQIEKICSYIIASGANVVCVEKGVSDLACHFLSENGITALRRFQRVQLDRVAAATGAKVVTDPSQISEKDIGLKCKLYECKRIGDDFWSFFDDCDNPKACTMLLRGPSKDLLLEMFHILDDGLKVAKNMFKVPYLLPGGGATEISIAATLKKNSLETVDQSAYAAAATAFEVIPRTLIQNSGAHVMKTLTELRSLHSKEEGVIYTGVHGRTGKLVDMKEEKIFDPLIVKSQAIKTAFECAISLIRVDDIISGVIARDDQGNPVQKKSVTQKLEENTQAEREGRIGGGEDTTQN